MDLLTASIADLKKQMEKASQNREAENKAGVFCFDVLGRFSSSESEWRFQEFQTLVTEQRETQRLLKDALTALKEFYMKNPAGFLSTLGRTILETSASLLVTSALLVVKLLVNLIFI